MAAAAAVADMVDMALAAKADSEVATCRVLTLRLMLRLLLADLAEDLVVRADTAVVDKSAMEVAARVVREAMVATAVKAVLADKAVRAVMADKAARVDTAAVLAAAMADQEQDLMPRLRLQLPRKPEARAGKLIYEKAFKDQFY